MVNPQQNMPLVHPPNARRVPTAFLRVCWQFNDPLCANLAQPAFSAHELHEPEIPLGAGFRVRLG
jgi:hypothetical protein